jgi:hypothetical protein
MPAPHVETAWYLALPAQYRDRVSFDPVTGYPTHIDVAAGAYTVPGALTNTDRAACRLPPLIQHPIGRR